MCFECVFDQKGGAMRFRPITAHATRVGLNGSAFLRSSGKMMLLSLKVASSRSGR
jgi:hypothetical protein